MSLPPGIDDGRGTLVIVDLSGWIHRGYHLHGIDGIVSHAVGCLVDLLTDPAPGCVAVALDCGGPTWRHQRTEGFDPARQYKAGRPPKPPEFYAQADQVTRIVTLHRIPLLWADGFEADDCIAAAVEKGRAEGLQVFILTEDKDLGQLVTAEAPAVSLWNGRDKVSGPEEILARFGVFPEQLGDFLSIVGDSSDNVDGARGLGDKAAAEILAGFGTLAAALAVSPPAVENPKPLEGELRKAKKRGGDAQIAAEGQLAALRARNSLAKKLAVLHRDRDTVELARELVTLDPRAPIAWDREELPVGGFDVRALREVYQNLGFTRLAREIRPSRKPSLEEVLHAGDAYEEAV